MADDEGLFGSSSGSDNEKDDKGNDSDDTAELLEASRKSRLKKLGGAKKGGRLKKSSSSTKKSKKKKEKGGSAKKKKKKRNDDTSDDDNLGTDFEEEGGDSDDGNEDDGEEEDGPPKSKKERMAALMRKRRRQLEKSSDKKGSSKKGSKDKKDRGGSDGGYDSEDSYKSASFQKTADDDAFIDDEGDDEDLLAEYDSQKQNFKDDRPQGSDSEDEDRKKKRGRVGTGASKPVDDGPGLEVGADGVPLNEIMAAAQRMKRYKRTVDHLTVREDRAREFLNAMEDAAESDERAIAARGKGGLPTARLMMIPRVRKMLAKRDMIQPLLEHQLLRVARTWIQPLPSGKLGNVTVRKGILEAIAAISSGDSGGAEKDSMSATASHSVDDGHVGITASDLKRSDFGRTIMTLFMHPEETPELKSLEKKLIEEWSRPIFKKSGDMRDLEKVHSRNREVMKYQGSGFADTEYRAHRVREAESERRAGGSSTNRDPFASTSTDLGRMVSKAKTNVVDLGSNRVRVPYSRGFQYTVRPEDRSAEFRERAEAGKQAMVEGGGGVMSKLKKKMAEKKNGSNVRSADVSIGGKRR